MPQVTLGEVGEDSIAATVYALVDRAANQRPEVVAELEGSTIRLCLGDGYRPVRLRFTDGDVEVGDDEGGPVDLVVRGALPDLQTLLTAPLIKGVPRSKAALARLADGRVQFDGPMGLGRCLLRLLSVP